MAALETPEASRGFKAPNFRLKGVDDKWYTLADIKGKKGTLVMFICNHCPFVRAITDRIVRDVKELQALGVGVVGIMANDTVKYPEDSFDNMVKFAKQHSFTFPYVIDETQATARSYGAVCTPDFFGFNTNLELEYRGRLDASRMQAEPNAKRDLFEAMKQVAETGKGPKEQFPSMGCSIKWNAEAA